MGHVTYIFPFFSRFEFFEFWKRLWEVFGWPRSCNTSACLFNVNLRIEKQCEQDKSTYRIEIHLSDWRVAEHHHTSTTPVLIQSQIRPTQLYLGQLIRRKTTSVDPMLIENGRVIEKLSPGGKYTQYTVRIGSCRG